MEIFYLKVSFWFRAASWLLVALLLNACWSSRVAIERVPADVPVVMKINLLSLALKLFKNDPEAAPDFSHILGTEISDDADKVARKLRKSGLNVLKAYSYAQIGKGEESYIACNFAMQNPKRFERFMRKFETHPIVWQDSINYTYINDQFFMGWDEELMVLLAMPKKTTHEKFLEKFLTLRSTPKDSAIISQNANFARFNKRWADISLWADMKDLQLLEKFQNFQQKHAFLENLNLDSNFLNVLITLKHGHVSVETDYFVSQNTVSKYAQLLKEGLNPNVVRDAPVAEPNGLLALGLASHVLPTLLIDLELSDEIARIASLVEMEEHEIMNIFSGDIVLLLKEVQNKEEMPKYQEEGALTEGWHYEVAIGFALNQDRYAFDRIMETLLETKLMKKEPHELHYVFFEEIFLFERENIIYLTKSEAFHQSFEAEEILDNDTLTFQSSQNGVLFHFNRRGWQNLLKPMMAKPKNAWLHHLQDIPIETINVQFKPLDKNNVKGLITLIFEDKKENTVVTFYRLLKNLKSSKASKPVDNP